MKSRTEHLRWLTGARRSGVVLLTVLVVITLSALIGTTLIVRASAERAGVAASLDRMRLRALAWSGVQGVLAEIESQRDALLDGGAPLLNREWRLWEEGGRKGVVRLRPVRGEEVCESECAKIDVNRAEEAMLALVPGLDGAKARSLVGARGSGELGSAEALGGIEGISWDLLYGGENADGEAMGGLMSYLTVFAFDPNTQAGVSQKGRDARGEDRFHVAAGWSEEARKELEGRLSGGAMVAAEAVLRASSVAHESAVVGIARGKSTDPEAWGEVLDVLTVRDDAFLRGRVDVTRAPAQVIACIPGIDAPAAERIVQARSGLGAEERRGLGWLVKAGGLTPDQFQQAAAWVTTRSTVWRVRVEASIEAADQSDIPDAEPRRVVWDAVIDASAPEARVAYLRDITYLPELHTRLERAAAEQERRVATKVSEETAADAPPAATERPETPDPEPRNPRENNGREASTRGGTEVKDERSEPPEVDAGGTSGGAPVLKDRRIGRWRGRGA